MKTKRDRRLIRAYQAKRWRENFSSNKGKSNALSSNGKD